MSKWLSVCGEARSSFLPCSPNDPETLTNFQATFTCLHNHNGCVLVREICQNTADDTSVQLLDTSSADTDKRQKLLPSCCCYRAWTRYEHLWCSVVKVCLCITCSRLNWQAGRWESKTCEVYCQTFHQQMTPFLFVCLFVCEWSRKR